MSFLDEIEKNYFSTPATAKVAKPAKVHHQSPQENTNFRNFRDFRVRRPPEVKKTQYPKAKGYGCAKCGNRIYTTFSNWKPEMFKSAFRPVGDAWQCNKCGSVYALIDGSRGPEYLT